MFVALSNKSCYCLMEQQKRGIMDLNKITVYSEDGSIKTVNFEEKNLLSTLQEIVGGYIEIVPPAIVNYFEKDPDFVINLDEDVIIVNEEGSLNGMKKTGFQNPCFRQKMNLDEIAIRA